MDIKLKLFCAVAETRSFSKASKIVHLTQPAVSLQIQALEEFFETKLFDRSEGAVRLTPSGRILYRHAKHLLQHYTDIEKEIGKVTGMIKGGITVGASTTLGNHVLPRVIIDFKRKHPKIKFSMLVSNTKRIEDLLMSGLIDLGLVEGEVSRSTLRIEPIVPDELTLIVPPAHPWARKKVVPVLDITREPFILREEGSGTRDQIEGYLKAHGVTTNDMHIALTLGSTESIKEAVEAGIGISIVSKLAVKKEVEDGRLKLAVLREGKILRSLSLIMPSKARLSPAVEEFALSVKSYPYEHLSAGERTR
ncbi:MAG: selenium metabolism-associated LysR family transcriptional regulator [Nitrospirota bacterium]